MNDLIKWIEDFVSFQVMLLTAFFKVYPDCKDLRFLLDFPKKGIIELNGNRWSFIRHGAGLLFIREADGLEIDARRAIGISEAFDSNRIEQFLETSSQSTESLESDLNRAINEGKVLVIDEDYKLLKLA